MKLLDALLTNVTTPTGIILFLLLIIVQLGILGGGFAAVLITSLRKERPRVIAFVLVGLNSVLGVLSWLIVGPVVFIAAPFAISLVGSVVLVGKQRRYAD